MTEHSTMERYRRIEPLGDGAYGVVFLAIDNVTRQHVALKKIKITTDDGGVPSTTLREISVLKILRHENIVKLLDVVHDNKRLFLAFELVDKDLKQYFKSTDVPLSSYQIKTFAWQLLKGLEFCHVKGIMHRDLKPQNILISKEGTLKIADFGLARAFVPPIRPFTHEVVTLWYRAPEILLGSKTYALPVDMWSVGTIIAEMATKCVLFPGDSEVDEIFKIFRILGTPDDESWPGVTRLPDWNTAFPIWPSLQLCNFVNNMSEDGIDLIENLITLNPARRLSAREAMNHPYFADFQVRN